MATTIPGMFTTTEAAEVLGISPAMVRRYCGSGRLSADRIGRDWVITRKELDRFRRAPRKVGNPSFRKSE